ncbi:hypothetical protein BS47DRAFT_426476 [Hydnum rufescens UP504]|uniref:Uncharacterized protein n=1 Tax=Hydnum rufescens UP504 TaxID=1448309 RepID=A0A9P6B5X9_9AGAM|nr:hypothetical protein BS47DRAFT_426476 [Hydnum rufescens UP504]
MRTKTRRGSDGARDTRMSCRKPGELILNAAAKARSVDGSCRCGHYVMKPSDLRNLPPRNKSEQGPNSWCSFVFAFASPFEREQGLPGLSFLHQGALKNCRKPGKGHLGDFRPCFGHVLAGNELGCTIITPQIFESPRTAGDCWLRRFDFYLLQIYLLIHRNANRSRAVLGAILMKNGTKDIFQVLWYIRILVRMRVSSCQEGLSVVSGIWGPSGAHGSHGCLNRTRDFLRDLCPSTSLALL